MANPNISIHSYVFRVSVPEKLLHDTSECWSAYEKFLEDLLLQSWAISTEGAWPEDSVFVSVDASVFLRQWDAVDAVTYFVQKWKETNLEYA